MTREELQHEVRDMLREQLNLRIRVIRPGYGQSAQARIAIELDGYEITYDTLDFDEVSEP